MVETRNLIQRKRLGEIRFMEPEGKFGFIDAEDFRDDVFFHKSAWESGQTVREPAVSMVVEFELDEDHFREKRELRAKIVRLTDRPYTKTLIGNMDRRLKAKHHPKARKRKPTWRSKD